MYESEVAKGATWLDQVKPGWEWKIDLVKLSLNDFDTCVLGQIEGPVAAKDAWVNARDFSAQHGFGWIPENNKFWINDEEGREIKNAWTQEILRRRKLKSMQEEILEKVAKQPMKPSGILIPAERETATSVSIKTNCGLTIIEEQLKLQMEAEVWKILMRKMMGT